MILYINACVRRGSRTDRIARALLEKLGEYEEVNLSTMGLKTLYEETLQKRADYITAHDYSDNMFDLAKQFASADIIVIAAPHWDLSFPALLKVYIENIYVTGIVSRYDENGVPLGLCRAEKLYYVTTSGGPLVEEFGYSYIRDLMIKYMGVGDTTLIKAEMLDVDGLNSEKIVCDTIKEIENMDLNSSRIML